LKVTPMVEEELHSAFCSQIKSQIEELKKSLVTRYCRYKPVKVETFEDALKAARLPIVVGESEKEILRELWEKKKKLEELPEVSFPGLSGLSESIREMFAEALSKLPKKGEIVEMCKCEHINPEDEGFKKIDLLRKAYKNVCEL